MSYRLPKNYTLLLFDDVDSSNEEAKRLVRANMGGDIDDVTIVWAKSQTRGRGRSNRKWISPPGNLYASLLIKPEHSIRQLSQLSFITALAVRDTIECFLPNNNDIHYKWPNDILLNGKKVSGIILETASIDPKEAPEWLIIGVGINIKEHPTENVRTPATCLQDNGFNADISTEEVLCGFLWNFHRRLEQWKTEGFASLKEEWVSHAKGIGEEVLVEYNHEFLNGTFQGIDHDGAMVLKQGARNTILVSCGEISFDTPSNTNIKEEATG